MKHALITSAATLLLAALTLGACKTSSTATVTNKQSLTKNINKMKIYDFTVKDKKQNDVSLEQFKGQVLLVVNTASRCGFTPQYEALEAMYERLHERGLEILDFPCNQFGQQAPGSDEEIAQFCQLNYGTKFPQFTKADVNGVNEMPLYTWLKAQKGFAGFDEGNKLTPLLNDMLAKADPDFASKPDIKWNFTKFLIDRKGNVVARFEPTHDMEDVERQVEALL